MERNNNRVDKNAVGAKENTMVVTHDTFIKNEPSDYDSQVLEINMFCFFSLRCT